MSRRVSRLSGGPRSWLAWCGEALRRHQRAIVVLHWLVIVAYAVLVTVPVLLPLPAAGARIVDNLRLFAQFAFWGLWWPFVVLSVMLLGRAWCGLLCPEGALTEWASRHGLGRSVPRWLRWPGWPLLAFAATTVYGQLVSVYEYPAPALLVLGGSTVAAVAVGAVYGRGKRVWCRYLCPVSGVFALLARLAPLHFRADAARWRAFAGPEPRVNCAPLLDLRHLRSAAECHACGRCSGHRGAIELAWRSPSAEMLPALRQDGAAIDPWPARLLVFGLLGLAPGAFHWSASPAFVRLKQAAAAWLVEHGGAALLELQLPWWLLTNQPAAGDVFNALDGLCILAWLAAATLGLGGTTWLALRLAARCCGRHWTVLAMALLPLAGAGLFLGLSMMTVSHLRAEGWAPPWLMPARALLLGMALAWSAWAGWRLVAAAARPGALATAPALALAMALSTVSTALLFL